MKGVIELQLWQLAAAYIFILLLIGIVRWKGIPREKLITIATVRMTVQLVLVAYVLTYIFDNSNPFYTIGIVALMEAFAIMNVYKRVNHPLSGELKKVIAFSMIVGTFGPILFFIFVVIGHTPWFEPQYVVPISGMIIGNAMTGAALGADSLMNGMKAERALVEGALMLGATPKQAANKIVKQTFDQSILPTVNSMVGMGIVTLPGMMTGQILSGTSPLVAIQYQIAIMLGICGSASLTVIIFVEFGYRTFFNKRAQLK
ncbi:iron export ABC transporter permease subunit FetB [Fictibacillus sp. Mic-4]|uniref:ABC transporter permease n=1 Tax=Fictibacillus TaxID=1329200 RepID=UPI00041FD11D|nr:iron export ABC transporter permease subunit FetB [Fictibacillus gelatini]